MTSDADDLPRLSKRMGELGLCSRREAEAWIIAGWVKVDGQVVDVLGTRVSREARIEVVGTVFTVRDRGGTVTVGVEHGHVRVRVLGRDAQDPATEAAATLDLLPGQVVDIRNGQPEAVRQADAATLSAWREGWLVFENTPLAEALATVNAYRTQPIEAADARVAALRLTGRFRANDSAGLLAVLPSILPLRVRAQADGSVQLQAL